MGKTAKCLSLHVLCGDGTGSCDLCDSPKARDIKTEALQWPDTVLAKTVYNHFADFEGLAPDEAADLTGALLYSLQQIGVVGSMPEPGNGVRVADAATEDALRAEDWFHDSDMGAR